MSHSGIAGVVLFVTAGMGTVELQGQGGRIDAWAPMPEKPSPFVPPHKPLTKLSDLLAKHKGQQDWSELVVNDNLFHGSYISMAAGGKTARRSIRTTARSGSFKTDKSDSPSRVSSRSSPPKDFWCRSEAPRLQHGDGGRRAIAALRSADGQCAHDVSSR